MSPRKPTLDDLVNEARQERAPDVDWAKMEEPLFARVEREASARAAIAAYEGKRRTWVVAGVMLAAAAAVPLFLAGAHETRTHEPTLDAVSDAYEPSAGALSWKEPNASVQITRGALAHAASASEAVARGDVVEVHGGRAVFTRTDPSGVTWSAEDNARVAVQATRGTLILALARGAVEAQVAPVANGEAFAIDVAGTRVAVHGTHLRVAREGARATIDLREGVVSIGLPPRSGSTYGDLITAPAHVEFDASDPHGTLKVSHEVTRVRAAAALDLPNGDPREARLGAERSKEPLVPVTPSPRVAPSSPLASPSQPASPPIVPAPRASVASPTLSPASVAAPVPTLPTPPQVDPHPESTIVAAIRACESAHVAVPPGVVVTVKSSLDLRVADSGMVESARFDPPLAPDVQECAVRAIYGTRFSSPGAVSIAIDFTR